ncbi:uncharacterized protein PHALS_07715 [Plasmopara halstedii]|uniref:Uncharacterized protein n=1 Tax=Plasmopara halstedii TaxID=4781 RepID=A0A0P1B6Q9_PLAHL|nr:uncharacterized protein PHALS_07715 [Plasmopara halstedii]CEG49982.1 hypothetical protein PHALS_07715 [Plasmopara halstedii]|eukprot:XP_024586351.1 hypothetical protein PHALS_07715 [Plasmopara halstedii]
MSLVWIEWKAQLIVHGPDTPVEIQRALFEGLLLLTAFDKRRICFKTRLIKVFLKLHNFDGAWLFAQNLLEVPFPIF